MTAFRLRPPWWKRWLSPAWLWGCLLAAMRPGTIVRVTEEGDTLVLTPKNMKRVGML